VGARAYSRSEQLTVSRLNPLVVDTMFFSIASISSAGSEITAFTANAAKVLIK